MEAGALMVCLREYGLISFYSFGDILEESGSNVDSSSEWWLEKEKGMQWCSITSAIEASL